MKKIINATFMILSLTLTILPSHVFQPNLEGLKYARIQCELNNVQYFQTIEDIGDDEKISVLTAFYPKNNNADKKIVQIIYDQLKKVVKKSNLKLEYFRLKKNRPRPSILPTICLHIESLEPMEVEPEENEVKEEEVKEEEVKEEEVKEKDPRLQVSLVYVTVSKWVSSWSGSKNIQTPVITWWQKKLLVTSPDDMDHAIKTAAFELMDDFAAELTEANSEKNEEEEPKKESKKESKKERQEID